MTEEGSSSQAAHLPRYGPPRVSHQNLRPLTFVWLGMERFSPELVKEGLLGVLLEMSTHIDTSRLTSAAVKAVVSVSDFALENRLTSDEQLRLLSLFGSFASTSELMTNARFPSRIR